MHTRTFVALTLLAASGAAAQDACRPGSDSNEARMLAFFAAPLAFSPSGNTGVMRSGEIRVAFDATYVPSPSAEITSPEKCYRTDKTENTELSPVFPRPRVAIGLGGGVALEAMYLPPVTVLDATPNLLSVAVSYMRAIGGRGLSMGLRGHATVGQIGGPITCSKDVIQSTRPTGSCYATKPSDDTYKPNMVGGEALVAFGGPSKIRAYLGAGVTSLRPRFDVGYIDALNNVDNTRLEVDLTRFAAFAGAAYRVTERFALTGELYSVPEDVTTVRFGGAFTLRSGK